MSLDIRVKLAIDIAALSLMSPIKRVTSAIGVAALSLMSLINRVRSGNDTGIVLPSGNGTIASLYLPSPAMICVPPARAGTMPPMA